MLHLDTWLDSLILDRKVSSGTRLVISAITDDPGAASYLSAQKLADQATVNCGHGCTDGAISGILRLARHEIRVAPPISRDDDE